MSGTETVASVLQNDKGELDTIAAVGAAFVAVVAAEIAEESAEAAAESAEAAAESADAAAESAEFAEEAAEFAEEAAEAAAFAGAEAALAVVEEAQEAAEQQVQELTFEQVAQEVDEIQEILARNEDACEDPAVLVDVHTGNEKILSAADSIIDNMTPEHLYDIYQLMDCKDKWTTPSQKVTLAAGTASVAQLAMIGVKTLIGTYVDMDNAAAKIAALETELAITKLALKDTEEELEECEEEQKETEAELAETKEDLEECAEELAKVECEKDKLEHALEVVLDIVDHAEEAVEEALNNEDCLNQVGHGEWGLP
jgi:hypothetical protein